MKSKACQLTVVILNLSAIPRIHNNHVLVENNWVEGYKYLFTHKSVAVSCNAVAFQAKYSNC